MFRFAKRKNSIRKVSEECRKYFFSDVENTTEDIEEENLVYEENTDVEQLKETEPKNEKRRTIYVDEYFIEAARFVIESDRASSGQLMRRYSIGYNRSGRILDQLCKEGIVGKAKGTGPREVLFTLTQFEHYLKNVNVQCDIDESKNENNLQENIQCEKEENSKKDFFSEDIKIDAIELMRYIDTLDGYNFEKVCAHILCCNGYINICVTSGSKDRGIDIIAEKDGMKYAVQCKHYSSNVGNHAVQEAFSGKSIYNADVAVVLTNSYFTQQAEQDARTLCVELWNRSKLLSMIENVNYISEVTEQSYEKELSDDCLKLFCESILEAFRQFQVYLMAQSVYVENAYIKYSFALEKGIRIKKVLSLQNDISLNLGISIQINVNYEKSNIEIIIPKKFLYERYMQ
mgnify:FL=1